MNNAVIRKRNLIKKIELVNNNSLSLEGFFSFLFKDNKEPVKNELSLHELIEKIKEGTDISIHSQFKNFHNYYRSLEDLEGPLLNFIEKNIARVTKYLEFFHRHKENIDKYLEEAKKLGAAGQLGINSKDNKGRNRIIFKSKYYIGYFTQSNNNDHLETEGLNQKQLDILKYPTYLIDVDFIMLINIDNKEKISFELADNEKSKLLLILNKISNKLKNLKKQEQSLNLLFLETAKEYAEVLINLNTPDIILENEYHGFGGSMHQGLGYLYEIRSGFEKDLKEEIKVN